MENFDPEIVLSGGYSILGAGVWGTVYDLGDGAVLKLAKEKGGIGSGCEKVRHEIQMMNTLSDQPCVCSFSFPKVLGYGDIVPDSNLGTQGYAIWLHSTKIEGVVFQEKEIRGFPAARQKEIAVSLGKALADFHGILDRSGIEKILKPDGIFECLKQEDLCLTQQDQIRLKAALSCLQAQGPRGLRAVHGDFNISNILFNETNGVAGILDFAEMCLGTAEDDICSLTTEMPFLKDMIIRQYEEETGRSVDRHRLCLAEMKRDLIGLLICRYQLDRPEEAQSSQIRLDAALNRLSKGFVSSGPAVV